jgi:hypothetical protein
VAPFDVVQSGRVLWVELEFMNALSVYGKGTHSQGTKATNC